MHSKLHHRTRSNQPKLVVSFVPPTLWEWNRSLGVSNSVWAWLEGVENVRPSLEPALLGAGSGVESRGSGRGGLPQLIGIGENN